MRFFRRCLIFLSVNLLMLCLFYNLLVFPSGVSMRMTEFRKDSYNSVILGHSWARDGLDPFAMARNGDDRIFNLCQGGIEVKHLKYLLKELEKTSRIQRIYLDLCPGYWSAVDENNHDAHMPSKLISCLSGLNCLDYIADTMLNEDFGYVFLDYEITVNTPETLQETLKYRLKPEFHERIPELLNDHASDKEGRYMGRGYNYITAEYVNDKIEYQQYDTRDVSREILQDFEELLQYCRDRKIQIIGVISALPAERLRNENWNVVHDFYQELFREKNLPFYDMNYVRWELLPRNADDYSDNDGHMGGLLAERHSALLREILLSEDPDSYFESSYQAVLAGLPAQ